MYDHNSIFIVALLLSALVGAIEIGFRIGRRFSESTNEATRSQINSIQASILGLLALLLGFIFSLALQRYDTRSQAVVSEANAIGTGILRASLIPAAVRTETQDLLR